MIQKTLEKADLAVPGSTNDDRENSGAPSISVLGIIYHWSCE